MGVSSVTIMVVGILWLSISIMPSSAQVPPSTQPIPPMQPPPQCWVDIGTCLLKSGVNLADPNPDFKLCCSEIKVAVANATCFCSMKDFIQNLPKDQPTATVSSDQIEVSSDKILHDCETGTTYDQLCNGKSGNMSGNGAKNIASLGLLPGALMIWAVVMSFHL